MDSSQSPLSNVTTLENINDVCNVKNVSYLAAAYKFCEQSNFCKRSNLDSAQILKYDIYLQFCQNRKQFGKYTLE